VARTPRSMTRWVPTVWKLVCESVTPLPTLTTGRHKDTSSPSLAVIDPNTYTLLRSHAAFRDIGSLVYASLVHELRIGLTVDSATVQPAGHGTGGPGRVGDIVEATRALRRKRQLRKGAATGC
jgi:hypothetical protein